LKNSSIFVGAIVVSLLFVCTMAIAAQNAQAIESSKDILNAPPASVSNVPAKPQIEDERPYNSQLILKVQTSGHVKFSKLRTGSMVEGVLSEPVYSGERQIFASGSRVQLTVSKLEQRRREPNDHWPWVVRVFTRRRERYPLVNCAVVFSENQSIKVPVALLSTGNKKSIHLKQSRAVSADDPAGSLPGKSVNNSGTVLRLQTVNPTSGESSPAVNAARDFKPLILAGTTARIMLLANVSASRNHSGDSVRARLLEPVRQGSSVVLPEGSLLQGEVVQSQAPRTLSRSGAMMLKFTTVSLPGGKPSPIAASIAGVEVDQRSHTAIDSEGQLRGERPGKLWMLLNIGATSGIAKEADDLTQLAIEAIVSTATDASTAGVARIVSTCASGVFMLTRHGRDVVLPKYTEMQIVFNRPTSSGQ
jgi:hypothetical protein